MKRWIPAWLAAAALAAAAAATGGRAAADEPVPDPVRRWIERQATIRTMIVDFRQERRLRTVRKPLVTTGTLWLTVGGPFRWQVGDPPKFIALLDPDGVFSVVWPEKKEATVWSPQALEAGDAMRGLEFLHAGFPTSPEEFRKRFTIDRVTAVADFDRVEGRPAGASATSAVRSVVFFLHRPTRLLSSMQLEFRDGSTVVNTFTELRENPPVPAERYKHDLTGYRVERK